MLCKACGIDMAVRKVSGEGVLFTSRNFADQFCQELKGLSYLNKKALTLSVFGLPQSLETGFNATR